MLEILEFKYDSLPRKYLDELFFLRKKTFKDRLGWSVNCINDKEFDEYDNENSTYLLGCFEGSIICSVRFIEIKNPNMIMDTFYRYFINLKIPCGNYVESSRFFVDKMRSKKLILKQPPVSLQLFLAMIRYSKKYNYEGILTLVSHQMLKILHMSGWDARVVQEGLSEKKEKVYIVELPTNDKSEEVIMGKINVFMSKQLKVD